MRDKQAEVQLLRMDVDHYKNKLQQEKKYRECACLSKVVDSKEVQVNGALDLGNEPNISNGVENCQNEVPNGQNGNGLSNLHSYYINILPVKYRTAKEEIRKLEKAQAEYLAEKVEIIKKTSFYKDLAVSRRQDVKKLQAKLIAKEVTSPNQLPTSSTNSG